MREDDAVRGLASNRIVLPDANHEERLVQFGDDAFGGYAPPCAEPLDDVLADVFFEARRAGDRNVSGRELRGGIPRNPRAVVDFIVSGCSSGVTDNLLDGHRIEVDAREKSGRGSRGDVSRPGRPVLREKSRRRDHTNVVA